MRIATTIFDNFEKKSVSATLIVGVDPRIVGGVGERWKRERIRKAAHQAEGFYIKMGFEKVRMDEKDEKEELFYYEWTAKASQNFLEKSE